MILEASNKKNKQRQETKPARAIKNTKFSTHKKKRGEKSQNDHGLMYTARSV
jgi:hypothetical protein